MKIILSRKGFDSSVGKVASPIFSSGEFYSLPIPEHSSEGHSKQYGEIRVGDQSLGVIVNDLTAGGIASNRLAHLDPDLSAMSIPRQANWKPIFGQAGAAEKHLQNQGVKEGDVFVFYGWFRKAEKIAGKYQYVRNAPDLHVIFGWLQIEQRMSVASLSEIPVWAFDHPHYKKTMYNSTDSIYISTTRMRLPDMSIDKPGAGVFNKFDPALCLTAVDRSRSIWQLPKWFYPHEKTSILTYHRNPKLWELEEDAVLLRTVGRGQEFVLDCQEYPEAIPWLSCLLCLYDELK